MLVAPLATSLAERSILAECGWLNFVMCCAKAAHELSSRSAFARDGTP
jgi:hypothetical protein